MEDLQWFDASLGMNEVMRIYNGGTPHLPLGGWGGGVITSYVCLTGCSVGPLSFPFGGSSGQSKVNQGKLYPTAAWKAAWPAPQM